MMLRKVDTGVTTMTANKQMLFGAQSFSALCVGGGNVDESSSSSLLSYFAADEDEYSNTLEMRLETVMPFTHALKKFYLYLSVSLSLFLRDLLLILSGIYHVAVVVVRKSMSLSFSSKSRHVKIFRHALLFLDSLCTCVYMC